MQDIDKVYTSRNGEIAPGKWADSVLIDWPEGGSPVPVMTLGAGRCVFAARDFSR